jgi:hypothetical protein
MSIEQGDDEMRTRARFGVTPAGAIFSGDGTTTMTDEVDFRMRRLEAEAARERLAGPRDGLRQHVGHALMALGRAIHGVEPESVSRPALHTR